MKKRNKGNERNREKIFKKVRKIDKVQSENSYWKEKHTNPFITKKTQLTTIWLNNFSAVQIPEFNSSKAL